MNRRLRGESLWRAAASAEVMVDCLPRLDLAGRLLLVDDDSGALQRALAGQGGVETVVWGRRAVGGRPARPWPAEGPFAAALVRLPKGREALEMVLHAVAARLVAGGQLLVYGTNDEGIRSAGKRLAELLGAADTVDARRHSRVMRGRRPAVLPGLKGELADWRQTWELRVDGQPRAWVSYPGLFAHGRLDEGTELLLTALPDPGPGARVLDFGCGTGVIGAVVAARRPDVALDLLDIDALALEAARANVPGAATLLGADLGAVGETRYHAILSNPPIHTGKGEDYRVLQHLVAEAPRHLLPRGCLQLVLQARLTGAAELLADHFGQVEVVAENTRFRVWRARR